jgi:hypothetical protein
MAISDPMIARFACLVVLLTGCTSASEPTTAIDAAPDTVKEIGVADSAKSDAVIPDTEAPDTATAPADSASLDAVDDVAIDAGPPPPPVDCMSGSFGPSSYTLVDLLYEQQVGGCTSSACSDFVMFDSSCVMSLQVADVKTTATVEAGDCTLFKRWLTSDLLVNRLRDTVTCYYGKDGPGSGTFESTQLLLADGAANKKTWMCSDEPFASHRRCIANFRAKYFPGK